MNALTQSTRQPAPFRRWQHPLFSITFGQPASPELPIGPIWPSEDKTAAVEPFYAQNYIQTLARDPHLDFAACCLPRHLLLDLLHKQTNSVIDGLQFFLALRRGAWWERLMPRSWRCPTVQVLVAPTRSGDYLHPFRSSPERVCGPFYGVSSAGEWAPVSKDQARQWTTEYFDYQMKLKPAGFRPVSFFVNHDTLIKVLNGSPLLRIEMGLYTSSGGQLPRTPLLILGGVNHRDQPLPDEPDRLCWTKDGSGRRGVYGSLLIG